MVIQSRFSPAWMETRRNVFSPQAKCFSNKVVSQYFMSLVVRKPGGDLTRSDTNRAVQSLNMARGLKFLLQKVEGLYYPCSENKGADQLRGYREADLRLCFRIYKHPVFS